MLNYTIHELNRTVLIKKKRARPAVLQMAQFEVIPPGTGTDFVSLRCCSNRPGARSWAPGSSPLGLKLPSPGTSSAENASPAEPQEWVGCSTSLISFSLLSLLKQFLYSSSTVCKTCCKSLAFISPFCLFVCLKEICK